MMTRLLTAVLVVLVCATVSQAIVLVPGYSQDFENCGTNLNACDGVDNGLQGAFGIPAVNNSGSFNGTNVVKYRGSGIIFHGQDLTAPIVGIEFDAVFAGDDVWVGLVAGNQSEAGMSGGRTTGSGFNGMFGVDLRAGTDTGGSGNLGYRGPLNNAESFPAHYQLLHDRSHPTDTFIHVKITEIGSPSNVLDSQTFTVPAANRDRIETFTKIYVHGGFNSTGSQVDNFLVGTVPEPSMVALLGLGAGLLSFRRRRRVI